MYVNIDDKELQKFEQVSDRWWDPEGEFAPLHAINPLRVSYIADRVPLQGAQVIDIGCGGGLLCEALADRGAVVTGIDAGPGAIEAARAHATMAGHRIDYTCTTAESIATEKAGCFDIVTCLEMLEHVPDPAAVVNACARLTRVGGAVFFSTINRNPKAWLLAVVGAEYVLNLIPRGTHEYNKFIRPSELSEWARQAGLHPLDLTGMHYNPVTASPSLTTSLDVNYLMHAELPAQP